MLLAVSRIGYSLEESLADLVDNSIDATASGILIRFARAGRAISQVAIVDDGVGMTETELDQAMQFAAELDHKRHDLGKYGLGLKSASFSHCESLTVLTRHRGVAAGRRWTKESIRNDWSCESIGSSDARAGLDRSWFGVDVGTHGTVVLWEGLPRLATPREAIDVLLNSVFKRLSLHLGLHFHRFVQRGLRIHLDAIDERTGETGPPQEVLALDPVGYAQSGKPDYPKAFGLSFAGTAIQLKAHIWPPKSKSPNYRLGGGKVAQRQGLYFYRNDRLIQAGGWNGWQNDAEPHLSLARVTIDLPPSLDEVFEPNVQKSIIDVPDAFVAKLDTARDGSHSLRDYLRDAQAVYRRGAKSPTDFPVVPGRGLAKPLQRQLRKSLVGGGKRVRVASFRWEGLSDEQFFRLDRDTPAIVLNTKFRRAVLHGANGSAGDAPLVKTLLFLLLRDEFDRVRESKNDRDWLDLCNEMLTRSARRQA
jgi:hypothetical protein